ncbi:hypothetical protein FOZ62_017425 [Perkinsus olseni]|nr:hypothetical protein FOZ62_017425 [Perkinsus olseni]
MEYRQLKGILTEQERRSSIDVANLRGGSSASLGGPRRSSVTSVVSSRRGSLASNAASRRPSRVHPLAIDRFSNSRREPLQDEGVASRRNSLG